MNTFMKRLSNFLKIFSEKAIKYSKIANYRTKIEIEKTRIHSVYKKIGEKFYTDLKDNKEIESILEDIQPFLSEIENYNKNIEQYLYLEKSAKIKSKIEEDDVKNPINEEINDNNKAD